ncbi:SIR2 family protein [Luteolibacter ambystomatis]|uniref:SIR2 family protein n=1 Tax=Luteolibacter ambystomatis TaxID=2824561 RepID=A0A975J367_9BACT|nr:SIR2 family protein [Luteolibacter ambystomatis]QUE53132.1 SIR2 family protein [Luteolibacter ambystomatis]
MDIQNGSAFAPSASELAHEIAMNGGLPAWYLSDSQNLSRVASYYELTYDCFSSDCDDQAEGSLRHILETKFRNCGRPGDIHHFLAENADLFPLVVTTNYDTLIEDAYIEKGRSFVRVVQITGNAEKVGSIKYEIFSKAGGDGPIASQKSEEVGTNVLNSIVAKVGLPVIYKMHGSVESREFVITEEDYVRFLARLSLNGGMRVLPDFISACNPHMKFLFMGYSLEDWNFRVILENIRGQPRAAAGKQAGRGGGSVGKTLGIQARADCADSAAESPDDSSEGKEPRSAAKDHWAIQKGPTRVDKKIWEIRRVEVCDMDLNTFVRDLKNALKLQVSTPVQRS